MRAKFCLCLDELLKGYSYFGLIRFFGMALRKKIAINSMLVEKLKFWKRTNFMETPCLTDLQRLWSGLEGAKVSQNCPPPPKVSADVGFCLSLSPTTQGKSNEMMAF